MINHTTSRITILSVTILILACAPVLALAQDWGWALQIVTLAGNLLSLLVPLFIAVGLALFLWGLLGFILNSGESSARSDGRQRMIWGVIILFVMVSIWGLVSLLNELSGVGQGTGAQAPQSVFY